MSASNRRPPGDEVFDPEEDWGERFEPIAPPTTDSAPEGNTFATIGVGRRGYFSSAGSTSRPPDLPST